MGKFKKVLPDGVDRVLDDLIPKNLDIDLGDADRPFNELHVQSLAVRSGANLKGGTLTANGDTEVTILNSSVTANSLVLFSLKTVGGTPAPVFEVTKTAGVGFSVKSTAGNTSIYNYLILEIDPYT